MATRSSTLAWRLPWTEEPGGLQSLGSQGSDTAGVTARRHQFGSVARSSPTPRDPMGCSTPGLPVHHQLPELAQTHVHQDDEVIQPSHPLSSPSPPAFNLSQHQGLFQVVSFFASGGQSIGVSASIFPMNIQD